MRKVAIMDTSISSFNLGDKIIMESARTALEPITRNSFVIDMPTKNPLYRLSEFSLRHKDTFQLKLDSIDYKFVCGTNILSKNVKIRKPSWNLRNIELNYFKDFILVGVGTDNLDKCQNAYTENFYKKALSKTIIHSVRDNKAKQFLESLGFSAINTGCVTMWGLSADHCAMIPRNKADAVIFTLTDYAMNIESDSNLIKCILDNYKYVAFWGQGIQDLDYLKSICSNSEFSRINVISPNLAAYSSFLETHDCDYIGTRLHAGIKAMQMKKRSIIISVDNRTRDIGNDYGLVYLERYALKELPNLIYSEFETNIGVSQERITAFLQQFEDVG